MEAGGATLDPGTNMELRSTPSAGRIDGGFERKVKYSRRREEERNSFADSTRIMEKMEDGTGRKAMPHGWIVKHHHLLEKLWGWDRLVPFSSTVTWTEYIIYLQAYYSHNAPNLLPGAGAAPGSGLTDLAEICLQKEKDLVSLWTIWRTKMDSISPRKSIVLSCLILERAQSVISTAGCKFSDVFSAALLCISKEADLTCELMGRGAAPMDDYLIEQSSEIRICALSLMNCTSCYSVAAASAMLGIAKEAQVMCEWMRDENRRIDFLYGDSLPDLILDSHIIRLQTLDVMIKILEESSCAAVHKIGRKESAITNGPGSNGNNIVRDELANTTGWGCISDVLNSQDQKIKESEKSKGGMEGEDSLGKLWGWERLLPLHTSVGWSNYSNYLEKYYNHNALDFIAEAAANQNHEELLLDPAFEAVQIATTAGCDLAASVAIFCLKMEEELVSEWKAQVERPWMDGVLPVNTIIPSSLIKEHVLSMCSTGGKVSNPSAIAFVCITKESDLMIELLKHGAAPDNNMLKQSGVIRMCALGLANLKGHQSIAAAAAMLGMAKEARMMCDWIKRENKLPTFSLAELHQPEDARLIRTRTLDVMISILQESFRSS